MERDQKELRPDGVVSLVVDDDVEDAVRRVPVHAGEAPEQRRRHVPRAELVRAARCFVGDGLEERRTRGRRPPCCRREGPRRFRDVLRAPVGRRACGDRVEETFVEDARRDQGPTNVCQILRSKVKNTLRGFARDRVKQRRRFDGGRRVGPHRLCEFLRFEFGDLRDCRGGTLCEELRRCDGGRRVGPHRVRDVLRIFPSLQGLFFFEGGSL
mmetsp:Transcript_9758/g.29567  ORF Transcript_9758/g.29567 Transcript_9758/m.29567 type:complete len:212 (+) Transcript_9758:845-1480(+)